MKGTGFALVVTLLALATAPAVLARGDGAKAKLSGEIIEVRQQTRLENQGEETQIRVRVRNQDEHWLRLGPADEYGNRVQVGDQVRVRVMFMGEGDIPAVQSMHNLRTRERIRVRDGSGELVRAQNQNRVGEQSRQRQRDRVHQPAPGGGENGRGDGRGRGGRG